MCLRYVWQRVARWFGRQQSPHDTLPQTQPMLIHVHDDFPLAFWQEAAQATKVLLGQGLLAARAEAVLLYDGSEGGYSCQIVLQPFTDDTQDKEIRFCFFPERTNEPVVLALVVLPTAGVPQIHVTDTTQNVSFDAEEQILDRRLGKAVIAVLEYIHQAKEATCSQVENAQKEWQRYGAQIEKPVFLEIHIGDMKKDFDVVVTPLYAGGMAVCGGFTHYIVSTDFRVASILPGF